MKKIRRLIRFVRETNSVSNPENYISRVLITRHDKIGDFVLALPLCKAIKALDPKIRITVLVSGVNFQFASELRFIDDVILYGEDFNQTLDEIRDRKFDLSISCYIDTRLGFLLWRSGIPRRIAPATKFAQIFFNERIVQRRSLVEKTEWAYNLDLAKHLFPAKTLSFLPPLIEFSDIQPKNRVVFHPGFGGSSDGNLKVKDYIRLAKEASEIPGLEVVLTFGPNDQETLHHVRAQLDFPASLIQSDMSLMTFARYLAESRLFVSTSTGPMHLAGAVNAPTISFFGQSRFASSKRWSTISESSRQHNFEIPKDYPEESVKQISAVMKKVLSEKDSRKDVI